MSKKIKDAIEREGPFLHLTEAEATTAQVYLFAKDKFDMAAVKAWLKEKKIKAHKITEESDDAEFIHARVAEPEDFKPKSFRTIDIADGIKLRIGKLKEATHGEMPTMAGGQSEEVREPMLTNLRFDAKKFKDNDAIIKWADEHGVEVPKVKVPELNMMMPLIDRYEDRAHVQFGEYKSGKHVSGEVDDGVTAIVCIPRDMALHEAIEWLEEAGTSKGAQQAHTTMGHKGKGAYGGAGATAKERLMSGPGLSANQVRRLVSTFGASTFQKMSPFAKRFNAMSGRQRASFMSDQIGELRAARGAS